MEAIKILIAKSKNLQNEIVLAGRGTATPNEFYQKNSRWTEGKLETIRDLMKVITIRILNVVLQT